MFARIAAMLVLALASAAIAFAPARAADSGAARTLAAAIERRAAASSFAQLAAFGEAAARQDGREALRRLHYVAGVYLNQSEFDRFDHFNRILAAKAASEGDGRYAEIARVDDLKSRYDRGDTAGASRIATLAGAETDWFARVHAMSMEAFILSQQHQSGAALKLLFDAEAAIPKLDADSALAESDVWGNVGVALIDLNDLEGSAAAFAKADFVYADKSYPRPDFDDIYNMALQAVRLGEARLAHDLVATHHRLALRSDLPHLDVWDDYLCAKNAEAFGAPADVTACLAGLDPRLDGAEFLAPQLLSMRSIALARIGRVHEADEDLSRLRALERTAQFPASSFLREPEVAAEIMAAKGLTGPAFASLRAYSLAQAQQQAHTYSAGAAQVTAELGRELDTLRHQADLEQKVVHSQRWIGVLSALLIIGALAALVWQRRVAQRLAAARLKAEAASLAKTEFLANMSHEIRTPLNGVVAVADLLAGGALGERERNMAEIIRSSGQSLERLLSDVLDLARVEAGQLTIETAPFHAGDLMRSVAALCQLRADEKGLALETDIDPALERWFLGDGVRVRQILINLASNSVKFTEQGSVVLRGEASAAGRLRFTIIDTGVGFDGATRERLFARFQQADGSITRRFGGSGLGLAISRQLAELMDGVVDCESLPGEGSRFWFEAPLAPTEPPLAAAAANEPTPVSPRVVRVLVADDHATNQTVVRLMLEQFGVQPVLVDDGAKAVEAVKSGRFDAVLMDMQMPVMDGLEATRRIRAWERAQGRPPTPVLMVSANALPEHQEAGRKAGADGHVSKPFTVAGLMGALNAALDPLDDRPTLAAAG